MSLLSLIAVFLIEQLRPLNYRRVVAEPLGSWADFIESRFNAGARRHASLTGPSCRQSRCDVPDSRRGREGTWDRQSNSNA
jgi:hypothetical protein